MHEITSFLRGFPPFDTASSEHLAQVEASTDIAFYPQGEPVLRAGEGVSEHAFVIRTGQAELRSQGRVVDLLGPGDLFGLPSMLTAMPPGLDVVAAEDLLVYRIGSDAMLALLSGRSGLRFLGETVRERSLRDSDETPGHTPLPPLSALMRPVVSVACADSILAVAQRMRDADASSAVILCADGTIGIVTDHDLRNRVVAQGRSLHEPISTVMTPNASTLAASTLADEAALVALTLGIRHLLVTDAEGLVVGVVEDADLLAAQTRAPLHLRRTIAKAATIEELAAIARNLLPGLVTAHRAGMPPHRSMQQYSVLVESVLRRVVALRASEGGAPALPFALVVTGSLGRRELVPSSDVDYLLAWDGTDHDRVAASAMLAFAAAIEDDLSRCGISCDVHGVRASDLRCNRSVEAWVAAVRGWAEDPAEGQADIYLSALFDARAIIGAAVWEPVRAAVLEAAGQAQVRAVCARVAVAHRPPTGFMRDLVIEASGEHRGEMDIKAGALIPIVDIARWAWLQQPSAVTSTLERIAEAVAVLGEEDVEDLRQAFLVAAGLRLEHQVGEWEAGRAADDYIAPPELPGLVRRGLRDALRVIGRVQRDIDAGGLGRRR